MINFNVRHLRDGIKRMFAVHQSTFRAPLCAPVVERVSLDADPLSGRSR